MVPSRYLFLDLSGSLKSAAPAGVLFVALFLAALTLSFSGCFFFNGDKNINPDGSYFREKTDHITRSLLKKFDKKPPERIIVIDVVNSNGKESELGNYLTFKIYESLLNLKHSTLVPRGVILDTMKSEGIKVASNYSEKAVKKISKTLNGDAIMLGELVDLGVNFELNMKIIDVKTGYVMSAASENIEKKDSVVTMFESF